MNVIKYSIALPLLLTLSGVAGAQERCTETPSECPANRISISADLSESGAKKETSEPAIAPLQKRNPRLHLKTNAVGWGMAIANVAAEMDGQPHWSFTLPVYVSAWNYFRSDVKFRIFAVQPEARYWFSPDNEGWFAGAHLGLAWYNFATGGEFRTQDRNGNTPAFGGGLSAGYRLPLGGDKRWKVEFSMGGGVYRLHYDKFRNKTNGLLVRTEKKTWWGIDQLSVSFAYVFDLNGRKGGRR